jgi:hypothetical protein
MKSESLNKDHSMRAQSAAANSVPSPHPITSASDAEQFVIHLMEVMDGLLAVLEEETKLVRSGRVGPAAQLQRPKGDLAGLYVAAIARLKANHGFLSKVMPHTIDALRRRHDSFRALLQINLTVLATAHAVSEGIVRGVSGELARKAAPQTYGAKGTPSAPPRHAPQPLALSRTL